MSNTHLPLSQVIDDYLKSIRHEKGYAASTCNTYTSWLRHFEKWLIAKGETNPTIVCLNTALLRSYQYALSGEELRPRTIRSAFFPLRSLCIFLVEYGVLAENPCSALTMPKKDAAMRATTSTEEVVLLLQGVDRLYPESKRSLARAMIYALVYSGIRFQEMLDLRLGDINTSDGTLLVAKGKGSKSRLLYPPKECMDAIRAWMEVRDSKCTHDWLWAENRGRRMGDVSMRALLESAKAAAGIGDHDNIKPHSLRHAMATRMMENGAPIKAIQAALGHSQVHTTFEYLHLGEQEAKKMATYAQVILSTPSTDQPNLVTPQVPTKPNRSEFERRRRQRLSTK